MKYNGVIEKKLRVIEEKLEEMATWNIDSYETFLNSSLLQNGVERILQVCVEVMIDISERILAFEQKPPRNSSAENFQVLEEMRIIESADTYTDMIRFRNFIVHRYEKIDTAIVYEILDNKLENFRQFIHEIRSTHRE